MVAFGAWRPTALAALSLLLVTAPAEAQQVLRSPEAIARCICLERSMQAASVDLQSRRQTYEQRRGAFAKLEAEIERRRPLIDTADPNQVDAFRKMIEERDRQMVALRDTATPAYADQVERYNGRVATYNSACQGRSFDADVLYSVRQSLSCPEP